MPASLLREVTVLNQIQRGKILLLDDEEDGKVTRRAVRARTHPIHLSTGLVFKAIVLKPDGRSITSADMTNVLLSPYGFSGPTPERQPSSSKIIIFTGSDEELARLLESPPKS